ncbi:MAG TPA: flagellar biosynthetic protein FliO [Ignavibacteriaceae bacterium]|nr:flagellar biosynthetic protein FliO [Ignavibacteriaceae bacterium]
MSFLDVIKAIIPLFIIVGLLYGVLLFVKKYGITLKGSRAGSIPINVLSSQMIMPKKFISIVKVEDKLLVLGISEQSITLLKELDQPAEPQKPAGSFEEKNNFLDVLKRNLGLR